MSINYIPGSGYLLDFSNRTFEMLGLHNTGEFGDFCEIHHADPKTKPYHDFMVWADEEEINTETKVLGKFSVRIINAGRNEDYIELEEGAYFLFDEDDIIEKTLTEFGQALEKKGLFPEFARYTVFG